MTRIYVVVDRISSPSQSGEGDDEDDEEGGEEEEDEEEEEELLNELGDFFPDLDAEDVSDDLRKKDGGGGTFRRSNSTPASSDRQRRRQQQQSQHGHRDPEKISQDDGGRRRRRRLLRSSPRGHGATVRHHEREVRLAEQLARAVSASPALRASVDGITVGVSSDASRSAPGLEACAEAVERGARERRLAAGWSSLARSPPPPPSRGGGDDDDDDGGGGGYARRRARASDRLREASPERSPLAIVAVRPEDLECLADHHHHHHHHHHGEASDGIGGTRTLKCRVSTEWNGRGEYNSFADRAMGDWRRAWRDGGGVGGEGAGAGAVGGAPCAAIDGCGGNVNGSNGRPKVPSVARAGRREAADDDVTEHDVSEPISSVMVVIFLAVVIAHVWSTYGDAFLAYCKRW